MHDRDVVDELEEEGLHPLDRRCEPHDLVQRSGVFDLRNRSVNLEVLLEPFQGR